MLTYNRLDRFLLTFALCSVHLSDALAVSFDWAEVQGSLDSTWSYGQSWRVEQQDPNLIGKSNLPVFNWQGYHPAFNRIYEPADVFSYPEGAYSTNGDNGNLSFAKGESFTSVFKGLHELELRYKNMGILVRGMYFYDFALSDFETEWQTPTRSLAHSPCRSDVASDYACHDVRLLDYFFFADFELADGAIPVSFRIGSQVISWGESAFIPHGLSVVNPIDLARLLTPGAELKEAFIPQGMAWLSVGLTENVSIEGFYQYDWQAIRQPMPGSYFSTNDFVAQGGAFNTIQLGFSANPDQDLDFLIHRLNNISAEYEAVSGQHLAQLLARLDTLEPGSVPWKTLYTDLATLYLASPTSQALMDAISAPSDGGQFGIKLTYFAPEWNQTEFGVYFMKYHSRRPLMNGRASNFTPDALLVDLNRLATQTLTSENINQLQAFSKVSLVYPENLKLLGLSFNTYLAESSWSGELAYRLDEPLQIDDVELLFTSMPEQLASAGLRPELANISQLDPVAPGESIQGFIARNTLQAQTSLAHVLEPILGADSLTVVAEIGAIWIDDLPEFNQLRLSSSGTYRSGGIAGKEGLEIAIHNGPETNPFPSSFSWGYRLMSKLDYNNAFWGMNVSPRLAISHDVNGITPDPISVFLEDRKSLSLGLEFSYLLRWQAGVSYNQYWGGAGTTNLLSDRDFMSFYINYSF